MTTDVQRNLLGAQSDLSEDVLSIRDAPSSSVFQKAIVKDILYDISVLGYPTVGEGDDNSDPYVDELLSRLSNSLELSQAPRNSIIVQFSSESEGEFLCYPFFPPHLSMPIKQGERVWVLREPGSNVGYWFCRMQAPQHVDDVNYTHDDRRWDYSIGDYRQTSDEDSEKIPDFPNGPEGNVPGQEIIPTLGPTANGDLPFERVYTGSLAAGSVVAEPVPRFTKRPGDLVLQGSNNTLICLGQDRGWNSEFSPVPSDPHQLSNASLDTSTNDVIVGEDPKISENSYENILKELAGAIDIVAGRGRIYLNTSGDPIFETKSSGEPSRTEPRVILNSRGFYETDKNPTLRGLGAGTINRLCDTAEGDPDFIYDASRIYVSMRSDVDHDYGLSASYPNPFEAKIEEIEDAACIVVKSDEIRIVARKKDIDVPYDDAAAINGSIRIIKEGTPDDDAASIIILPDGTVQISGSKIFLGRTTKDGGAGKGPGPGGSQPYVKYQELEDLLTEVLTNIKSFGTSLQSTFAGNTTPGFGAPNPSILVSSTAECMTLQTDMDARINQIKSIKSDRIFGE